MSLWESFWDINSAKYCKCLPSLGSGWVWPLATSGSLSLSNTRSHRSLGPQRENSEKASKKLCSHINQTLHSRYCDYKKARRSKMHHNPNPLCFSWSQIKKYFCLESNYHKYNPELRTHQIRTVADVYSFGNIVNKYSGIILQNPISRLSVLFKSNPWLSIINPAQHLSDRGKLSVTRALVMTAHC